MTWSGFFRAALNRVISLHFRYMSVSSNESDMRAQANATFKAKD